ncbi:MAG: cyclodeaminase/cyclohydrolase family protein [Lutisporaceae bacterium]
MSLLVDKTVKDFCEILASKEPAPGGGSTVALSGVLGASLTMMVGNVSFGKKYYEALEESIKEDFMKEFNNVTKLQKELIALVDEDTEAFNKFMDVTKLPKDTDKEKAIREKRMQEARKYTLEVPLKTAKKCLEVLENQTIIAKHGNKTAVSDVGVGALLALSGLQGAILNVNINLPGIKDEALRNLASTNCNEMEKKGRELHDRILEIVNSRIG